MCCLQGIGVIVDWYWREDLSGRCYLICSSHTSFGIFDHFGHILHLVQNNQQQQMLSVEGNYNDNSSTAQIKYTKSGGDEVSLSFMQMFFPSVSIGGQCLIKFLLCFPSRLRCLCKFNGIDW